MPQIERVGDEPDKYERLKAEQAIDRRVALLSRVNDENCSQAGDGRPQSGKRCDRRELRDRVGIITMPARPSVSRSHRMPILGTSPRAKMAPNISSQARDCGR